MRAPKLNMESHGPSSEFFALTETRHILSKQNDIGKRVDNLSVVKPKPK